MRKTLRALFLGSALSLTAVAANAQTTFVPIDNTMRPPSPEQEEIYGLLTDYLDADAVAAEPQVHALEQLEDDFYEQRLSAAEYGAARMAALRALYPELAATHEEFESRTGKIVGCTADGFSMVLPVVTFVNREDMNALFNRLAARTDGPGGSTEYLQTVTDLSNRLRQGLENSGKKIIEPFTTASINAGSYKTAARNHLQEMGRIAARDAQVEVIFRTLSPYEVDMACLTKAERDRKDRERLLERQRTEAQRMVSAPGVPPLAP